MYFSFFKPQDWRKRSVVRGRGFIQRFLRYYNTDFSLCHHRGRRRVSVSETALQQLVDALRVAALVERKFAHRASPRAGHGGKRFIVLARGKLALILPAERLGVAGDAGVFRLFLACLLAGEQEIDCPQLFRVTALVVGNGKQRLSGAAGHARGKAAGRGAYLCPSAACLAKARKAKRLERTFEVPIPDGIYDRLTEEIACAEQSAKEAASHE